MHAITQPPRDARLDDRGLGILARSLFKQMREQGYSAEQIIGLSAQLIELVKDDLTREAAE